MRLSGESAKAYMSAREDNPLLPSYIKLYGTVDDIITVQKPKFSDLFMHCGEIRKIHGTNHIEDTIAGLVKDSFSVSSQANISGISWYIIPDLLFGMHLQPEVRAVEQSVKKAAVQPEKEYDLSLFVTPGRYIRDKQRRIEIPYNPIIVPISDGVVYGEVRQPEIRPLH